MKKFLLSLAVLAMSLGAKAQITTNSSCDTNVNGTVSIEDVTNVVNKIIGNKAVEKEVVTADQINAKFSLVREVLIEILVRLNNLESAGEHAYVDLGLPSGTLWATCNVGATAAYEMGDAFAWGAVEPGTYDEGSWEDYPYCKGDQFSLTKYCNMGDYGYNGFTDDLTELEACDDAATVKWDRMWEMPSVEQIEELENNSYTTKTVETLNGVAGLRVTGKKEGYTDRSIFLPAAFYWGRTFYEYSNMSNVMFVYASERGIQSSHHNRCYNYPVRPVLVYKNTFDY